MQDQAARLAEAVSVFRLSGNGMASTALTPLFSDAPVAARRVLAPSQRTLNHDTASQSRALTTKVPARALSGGDWEEF
jgi:Flp pilus assembly protein CpaB